MSVPWQTSYVASAAREAGSVAELAAYNKMDKYTSLAADYHFQPIAVEMLGPINKSASHYPNVAISLHCPAVVIISVICLCVVVCIASILLQDD